MPLKGFTKITYEKALSYKMNSTQKLSSISIEMFVNNIRGDFGNAGK